MSGTGFLAKIRKQPAALWAWSERRLVVFAANHPATAADAALDIRINDGDHLGRFEQTVPWLSRTEFLTMAERRMAAGTMIFTCADTVGPLLAFGYAQPDARQTTYTHVAQKVIWPEHTATIYGGFVHPAARGRALHGALQMARIRHLIGEAGMQWVVSGVATDNAAALRSAAKTNLRPVAELSTRRRFGRARMTAARMDPAFGARYPDAERG